MRQAHRSTGGTRTSLPRSLVFAAALASAALPAVGSSCPQTTLTALRLRGGDKAQSLRPGPSRARAQRARSATAGNAWDLLRDGDDADVVGGKRRMTPAQKQKAQKRERERKKQREALDLDNDPRFNFDEKHAAEEGAGVSFRQQMGWAGDSSSEDIPDPDAPIELAAMEHLPWERPAEADVVGSRRADGSRTAWDRPRKAENEGAAAGGGEGRERRGEAGQDEDSFDEGDEDEPFRPRTKQADGTCQALTGDLVRDEAALERLAVRGVQWVAEHEWCEPHTRMLDLREGFPYLRALTKAASRGDASEARLLLGHLARMEYSSTAVIPTGLVKLVRKFVLHPPSLAAFDSGTGAREAEEWKERARGHGKEGPEEAEDVESILEEDHQDTQGSDGELSAGQSEESRGEVEDEWLVEEEESGIEDGRDSEGAVEEWEEEDGDAAATKTAWPRADATKETQKTLKVETDKSARDAGGGVLGCPEDFGFDAEESECGGEGSGPEASGAVSGDAGRAGGCRSNRAGAGGGGSRREATSDGSPGGGAVVEEIKTLARQVLGNWVTLAREEEEREASGGMPARDDHKGERGYIREYKSGAQYFGGLGGGGGGHEKVVSSWEVAIKQRQLEVAMRTGDARDVLTALSAVRACNITVAQLTAELLRAVKSLQKRKPEGDARVAFLAQDMVAEWRDQLRPRSNFRRARGAGAEGRGPRGAGGTGSAGNLAFDVSKVHSKSIVFSEDMATATRSDRGNPKVSVFVLAGEQGDVERGERASPRERGGSTSSQSSTRAPGGPGNVREWALRIDECCGGSLHVGCVANAYKASEAFSPESEWGLVGVLGEAYNLRHTAYLIGSSGQVWECSEKGPRSLTALVKEQIGDVVESGQLQISDGLRSFVVETSQALSFMTPGSTIIMKLDTEERTLSFAVNQSPPFVLTGVDPEVRPVVALKAVGDSVTLIDPRCVA